MKITKNQLFPIIISRVIVNIMSLFLTASLLSSCATGKVEPVPVILHKEFHETYSRAVALEKAASLQLLQADRHDRTVARTTDRKISAEESQLFETEVQLNIAMESLYAQSWQMKSGPDSDSQLRAALLHWAALVRRALMQGFHTRVPGLENDPDCAGDIIGDGMLSRYFDAVLAHRQADAALALSDLARQSACLSVSQSIRLGNVLASTFEELRAFLRLHGHEDIVPFVVQAGSNPLLLFYDVEKYRGLETPLARWFRNYRDILSEGADFGRNPARWHGLWLYDRRSGRLLGYRATSKPVDENDVDLGQFFQSIVSPENLGDYGCSFSEMVDRGAGALGYFCAGAGCMSAPGAESSSGGRSLWSVGDRAVDQTVAGMTGLDLIFPLAVCQAGSDGRGRGGEAPGCGGVGGIGGNRAAATVRCLTEQIVHPGTEGFHCLGETGGRCGGRAGSLIKGLQPVSYAGIKIGRDCTRAEGMGDVKAAERDYEDKVRRDQEARQKEIERLRALIDTLQQAQAEDRRMQARMDAAAAHDFQTYNEARAAAEAAGRDPNTDPIVRAARETAERSAREAAAARDATNSTILTAALLEAKAREDLKKREEEDKKKKEQEDAALGGNKGGDEKRCGPDKTRCGNDCTGMSQAARETLGCLQATFNPTEIDPLGPGPGGCDPRICDPIEPDPGASGTMTCFDAMLSDPTTVTSRVCWAVRCAQGQTPVGGPNGCTCRSGGGLTATQGGGVRDFCAQMLCAEGGPVFQNGHCTCSGDGGGLVVTGGGVIGVGGVATFPPRLGVPTTFSNVRYGPRQ